MRIATVRPAFLRRTLLVLLYPLFPVILIGLAAWRGAECFFHELAEEWPGPGEWKKVFVYNWEGEG